MTNINIKSFVLGGLLVLIGVIFFLQHQRIARLEVTVTQIVQALSQPTQETNVQK